MTTATSLKGDPDLADTPPRQSPTDYLKAQVGHLNAELTAQSRLNVELSLRHSQLVSLFESTELSLQDAIHHLDKAAKDRQSLVSLSATASSLETSLNSLRGANERLSLEKEAAVHERDRLAIRLDVLREDRRNDSKLFRTQCERSTSEIQSIGGERDALRKTIDHLGLSSTSTEAALRAQVASLQSECARILDRVDDSTNLAQHLSSLESEKLILEKSVVSDKEAALTQIKTMQARIVKLQQQALDRDSLLKFQYKDLESAYSAKLRIFTDQVRALKAERDAVANSLDKFASREAGRMGKSVAHSGVQVDTISLYVKTLEHQVRIFEQRRMDVNVDNDNDDLERHVKDLDQRRMDVDNDDLERHVKDLNQKLQIALAELAQKNDKAKKYHCIIDDGRNLPERIVDPAPTIFRTHNHAPLTKPDNGITPRPDSHPTHHPDSHSNPHLKPFSNPLPNINPIAQLHLNWSPQLKPHTNPHTNPAPSPKSNSQNPLNHNPDMSYDFPPPRSVAFADKRRNQIPQESENRGEGNTTWIANEYETDKRQLERISDAIREFGQ